MSRPSLLPFLLKSTKGKAPLRLLASPCPFASSSLRSSSTTTAPSSSAASTTGRSITPRSGDVAIPAANPASHFVPAKPKAWNHPVRLNVAEKIRPLPNIMTQKYQLIAAFVITGVLCSVFLVHVTNEEKLTSSVFRQVMYVLRTSGKVEGILGEGIRLESTWWTGGDPHIEGSINVLKGKADLSFRIKGLNNTGRVYFTSIRPTKDAAFQVLRFKLLTDDGQTVELVEEMRGKGYDTNLSEQLEKLKYLSEKPAGK
ncbi:cytochrome oxidase complex assembly protein 1-domain-containing protein [Mrakia frigida]|uniref:Coa1p n=1 Tax=Mrakia frigida TaxID=29902 RepID=UPI003FCBFA7A